MCRRSRRLTVHIEESGIVSHGRPDILVHEDGAMPIILETEFGPGRGVERDACRKIGVSYKDGSIVRTCLAVIVPRTVKSMTIDEMRHYVRTASDIRYAMFSLDECGRHGKPARHPTAKPDKTGPAIRYPGSGWLSGSLADLMVAAEKVSVPASNVAKCAAKLSKSSSVVGEIISGLNEGKRNDIARALNQPPSSQTWKMAALILTNAMVFYDDIASTHPKMRLDSIDQMRNRDGIITVETLRKAWRKVLDTNYYPIFNVALKMLEPASMRIAGRIIEALVDVTDYIKAHNLSRSSDLHGLALQKVINDRERLATYYTLPESAELMATLVLPRPDDGLWKSKKSLLGLRIADLACGTGLLLTSAYRQIIARHEARGGSGAALHEQFMRQCISGLDILPIAAHMTVSSLAGLFPNRLIRHTNIHHMPIGRWGPDRSEYRLGSLDLIDDRNSTLFESSMQVTGSGETGSTHHGITDGSVDLIVMNPPFTKAGKRKKNPDGGVDAVAPYAAFGISDDDQKKMGKIAIKKFDGLCGHGHAGLGSYFVAVCDKKIRPGGTMALILPSTLATGWSWSKVRELLRNRYDITVLSIANERMGRLDGAFSSDTGMLEVMLVARKRAEGDKPAPQRFVTLYDRPLTPVEGACIGDSIRRLEGAGAVGSGHGETPIMVGGRKVGYAVTMKCDDAWPIVNTLNPILVESALSLPKQASVPFTALGTMCGFGPDSQMLVGKDQNGPFVIRDLNRNDKDLPAYHALWNNDHKRQRTMAGVPDKALDIKAGAKKEHADNLWKTASHVHLNLDPRYTTQAVLAVFTDEKTAGGVAWPSVITDNINVGKALVMWQNSTFGILSYWMAAGRQQLGRGRIKRGGAGRLRVPDFLDKSMRGRTKRLAAAFDRLAGKDLESISSLAVDNVRHRIDRAVAIFLGMRIDEGDASGALAHSMIEANNDDTEGAAVVYINTLRRALSMEPSIAGVSTGMERHEAD